MPNHSSKKPKLPADVNERGKAIVDFLTGDREADPAPAADAKDDTTPDALSEAARALGRRGGLKGGKARAASMTPEQRSEIAKKAAAARWGKTRKGQSHD